MYVYTPIFTDPADGSQHPGKGDPVVLAVADVGPECRVPRHDPGVRFVLQVAAGTTLQAGWTEQTKAQVNADYPGLIP